MGALTLQWIEAAPWQYKLMLFSGWFAVLTNVDYLVQFARKDVKTIGSSLSHIGFGLMLIGILASGANKRVISRNTFLMEGLAAGNEEMLKTVILIRDEPMIMGDYELTLRGDTIDGYNRTYTVDYVKYDAAGRALEEFELYPNLLYNKDYTDVAITNPSTRHYWDKDIFTVIMSLPPEEQSVKLKEEKEDSLNYHLRYLALNEPVAFKDTLEIRQPDTFMIRPYTVELTSFQRTIRHPEYVAEPGDIGVSATVAVTRYDSDSVYAAPLALVLRGGLLYHYPAQLNEISTRVKIDESIFEELLVADEDLRYQEYTLKAGGSVRVGDREVTFERFQPQPDVSHYDPREGDVAVSAVLNVSAPDGAAGSLQPVFVIRDNTPSRIRDEHRATGIFANLVNINPQTGEATLLIAQAPPRGDLTIPIAIATDSERSDWLALQAIEFPGINLFWIGTIAMMLGLLINMVVRIRQRRRVIREHVA